MRLSLADFEHDFIILQTHYKSTKKQGDKTKIINGVPHRIYYDLVPFTLAPCSSFSNLKSYWDCRSFHLLAHNYQIDHLWISNDIYRKTFNSGFAQSTFFTGEVKTYPCSRPRRPHERHDYGLFPNPCRLLDYTCFDLIVWRPALHYFYLNIIRDQSLHALNQFFCIPPSSPSSYSKEVFDKFVYNFGCYNKLVREHAEFALLHPESRVSTLPRLAALSQDPSFSPSDLPNLSSLSLSDQTELELKKMIVSCDLAAAHDLRKINTIQRSFKRFSSFKGFGRLSA